MRREMHCPCSFRPILGALVISALSFVPRSARADCGSPIASSCVEPDHVWPTGLPSAFLFAPRADLPKNSFGGLRAVTAYLDRPLLVSTPGGGPGVNTTGAVSSRFVTTLGGYFALWNWGAVDAMLPIIWGQKGGGAGLASGTGTLPGSAVSDLRLGASVQLLRSDDFASIEDSTKGYAWSFRLGVSLPTAASGAFAGGTSVVLNPSTSFVFRKGRFVGMGTVGARIREQTDFLDLRLGQEISAGLGASVDVLEKSRLTALLETQVFVGLSAQRNMTVDKQGTRTYPSGRMTVPAEWHLSLRTSPISPNWGVAAGFGTAIPFGENTALGTPAYRVSLRIETLLR